MPHKVIVVNQLGTASLAATATLTFKNRNTADFHTERVCGYVSAGRPNMAYRRIMPKGSNGWDLFSIETTGPISVTFGEVSDVA